MNLAPKPYPLVDAVHQIGQAIDAANHSGEQVVLRATDYQDLNEALGHVQRLHRSPDLKHNTVELSATYGIHGTSLDDLDEVELPEHVDGTLLTVLVVVNSVFPIKMGTRITVIGTLADQLRQLSEDHRAHINQSIFVLDDAQQGS